MANKPKYIFVSGGVVSSLGKGILSASLGAILESRGLKVTILKLDPYINLDPCLLYTSPSPRDVEESRMPSSA